MSSYADIIKRKQKEWDCEHLMDAASQISNPKIPFSSPMMNYSTYGGIPRARVTEFFGDPGGGKSTTAMDVCKNAVQLFRDEYDARVAELQSKVASGNKALSSELEELQERGPKKVLYIDLENGFDAVWSETLGIDRGTIDIMTPPDVVAEDVLQTIIELVETGELGLVVLDSTPSLVPRAELEKKIGERTVAALAGLLTVFFRKITPMLTRYDTTLLTINQTRDNMDNPYVVQTPGGKAVKFYCSLRILFRIGTPIDFLGNELPSNAENPSGYIITAKIVKQKTAPWDRRNASYYLMVNSGIRNDIDMAQLAVKKYNIIAKTGAWFTICQPGTGEVLEDETGKPVKVNGMAKVLDYLQSHPDYFQALSDYIIHDIESRDASETVEG